jgi:hypothetical protein
LRAQKQRKRSFIPCAGTVKENKDEEEAREVEVFHYSIKLIRDLLNKHPCHLTGL